MRILVDEVEQYYARDLENVSLVDMQETIIQGLTALLSQIKTKKEIGQSSWKQEGKWKADYIGSEGEKVIRKLNQP